jgi:uncharacterized protein
MVRVRDTIGREPHPHDQETHVKCPDCSIDLLMTERQGVEIDYCPQCRGVWLARGKLDVIVERTMAHLGGGAAARSQAQAPVVDRGGHGHDSERRDEHHREGRDESGQRRRKSSLLGDLLGGLGGEAGD